MAFKVHLQKAQVLKIYRVQFTPHPHHLRFHLKSGCFLKMYETTIAWTKVYFHQNAERGEMIRGFFFFFRLLCTFQIFFTVVFTKKMSQIWAVVSQGGGWGALTCEAVLQLHCSGSCEDSVWSQQATGISV